MILYISQARSQASSERHDKIKTNTRERVWALAHRHQNAGRCLAMELESCCEGFYRLLQPLLRTPNRQCPMVAPRVSVSFESSRSCCSCAVVAPRAAVRTFVSARGRGGAMCKTPQITLLYPVALHITSLQPSVLKITHHDNGHKALCPLSIRALCPMSNDPRAHRRMSLTG